MDVNSSSTPSFLSIVSSETILKIKVNSPRSFKETFVLGVTVEENEELFIDDYFTLTLTPGPYFVGLDDYEIGTVTVKLNDVLMVPLPVMSDHFDLPPQIAVTMLPQVPFASLDFSDPS